MNNSSRESVVGSRWLPAGNPRPTLEKSVAPTALATSEGCVFPVLTGWANFWRAYGAGLAGLKTRDYTPRTQALLGSG